MTSQVFPQFVFVKKSSSHLSWSDSIEFMKFKYATAMYDNGVLCIKPCDGPSDKGTKCKEVRHFGRKFYLEASYKIPSGNYILNTIDLSKNTLCFKKVERHGSG